MGFLAEATGSHVNYQATPADIPNYDYGQALQQSMAGMGTAIPQQQQLAQMLMQQSQGIGPGADLAKGQLQQATERNQQMAAGAMASQRGMNPALAQRQILGAQAGANQQAAGQFAQLNAQQRLASQQQLAQALGQQRSQDIGQAGMVGGLQNAQNQTNVQNLMEAQRINAGVASANAQTNAGIAGGVLGGLGTLAAAALSEGGKVTGTAKVTGDSYSNDTVPAMLSPGEIVIPRSKANDPEKAKEFIDHLMGSSKKEMSYAEVLKSHKELEQRLVKLEKRLKKD